MTFKAVSPRSRRNDRGRHGGGYWDDDYGRGDGDHGYGGGYGGRGGRGGFFVIVRL